MDHSLELFIPGVHWRKTRYGNHAGRLAEIGFKCRYCQAYVHSITLLSGVQNRNHCPYCLRSRHMDLQRAGDRLSACKAIMQPIGLTMKACRSRYYDRRAGEPLAAPSGEPHASHAGEPHASHAGEPHASHAGELMVVHVCSGCGEISLNRIAADDRVDVLSGMLEQYAILDEHLRFMLDQRGIRLLQSSDKVFVMRQLYGNPTI